MDQTRNVMPFGLRLQPELKKWIRESAEKNHRSMNAEIVMRLEGSKSKDAEQGHQKSEG